MSEHVSIRDLRNNASSVIQRVEAGEKLVVTVGRRPVANLTPLETKRAFVPTAEIIEGLRRYAADPGLLDDLRDLLTDTTDDLDIDR